MHLKNVLGQIDTDSRNIHGRRSHPRLSGCKHFHFGTLMPFEGGGVHPIASRPSYQCRECPLLAIPEVHHNSLASRKLSFESDVAADDPEWFPSREPPAARAGDASEIATGHAATCRACDLARHPRELPAGYRDRVLRCVELHREKRVVTDDPRQVDNSLQSEARLGALERRIGNLLVLEQFAGVVEYGCLISAHRRRTLADGNGIGDLLPNTGL